MRVTSVVLALSFAGVALAQGQAPVISAAHAQDSLEDRVERMERIIESRGQSQARMMDQLNALQQEVSELRGVTEEHAHQLQQVLERQRDLYQEIERRMSEIRSDRGTVPVVPESTGTELAVAYSDNLSENEAYDRAIALVLEDRRYEQAIPEFRAFIENFPNSAYLGNAHYWLGQLLYARNDYGQARQHFEQVVNNHPDSGKRADCILKLGIIAQSQGNPSQARQRFQQVLNDYPDSTEATLARSRLDDM